MKKKNLYGVWLTQKMSKQVEIVASSKAEAKRKMKRILETTDIYVESEDWLHFDQDAAITGVEVYADDTEDDDGFGDEFDDAAVPSYREVSDGLDE